MWLRSLALLLGAAALAALLASGPGTRLGLWDWRAGLGLLRYAVYLGIASTVLSIAGALVPRYRGKVLLLHHRLKLRNLICKRASCNIRTVINLRLELPAR